jgi:retron-type reverse transcriptase
MKKNNNKDSLDLTYYETNEDYIKNVQEIENENKRFRTKHKSIITEEIKNRRKYKEEAIFNTIKNIEKTNTNYHFNKKTSKKNGSIKNTNLFNIAISIPLLTVAYNKLKRNKGALTKAYKMNEKEFKLLDKQQKEFVAETFETPDKISLKLIRKTNELLKKDKYPWGTSRRIYIEKPGKKALRPITIPPFMDKIVQENIKTILTAIYEPIFEKYNCSHGFRPYKGVHDSIYAITNGNTLTLTKALEGDIKSAYDKVDRNILIKCLEKRIKDKKFINLIRKRLNYTYYDAKEDKYIRTTEGLPQGGSDSPYLFNIYMLEFDEYIINDIQNEIKTINDKVIGERKNTIEDKNSSILQKKKSGLLKILRWIWKYSRLNNGKFIDELKELYKLPEHRFHEKDELFGKNPPYVKNVLKTCKLDEINNEKDFKKSLFKYSKDLRHKIYHTPRSDHNKRKYKLVYERYCDDWIILTNLKIDKLKELKEKIKIFLWEKLKATLSEEKTLITDLKKEPAHFLGFEIRTNRQQKITRYTWKDKIVKSRRNTFYIFTTPDKKRLIDRFTNKGFCNKHGNPRQIGKLCNLELFSIIDRYNSVLRGIVNYYKDYMKRNSFLRRWIYIIRYSCLKTIAMKMKSTINKILIKYGKKEKDQEKTITVKVTVKLNKEKWDKNWTLLTTQQLLKTNVSEERKIIRQRYWQLQEGKPIIYDKAKASVTFEDYTEMINWINIRTKASLELPCSICGSTEEIEMHHIKHVRKRTYKSISNDEPWAQVMGLKNRNQITVCKNCHRNLIHKGKNCGTRLKDLIPTIMYDNRLITIESHIHKGDNNINYKKSMEEKGWKKHKKK